MKQLTEKEVEKVLEDRDNLIAKVHSLEFQLQQEKGLNRDHEKDYLEVWNKIKRPNETVVQAADRVVKERIKAVTMFEELNRAVENLIRDLDRLKNNPGLVRISPIPLKNGVLDSNTLEFCREKLKSIMLFVRRKERERDVRNRPPGR